MKIKLDENMPGAMIELLQSGGHDVATVAGENLEGADDDLVLEKATEEGRLLMTFDVDFGDIRKYPFGSHAGIIVFRLHDQRWSALKEPAERLVDSDLFARLGQGLAVVDELRVRFRLKAETDK